MRRERWRRCSIGSRTMSSFSADWLALREPADHRARSRRLTQSVRDHLAAGTTVSVVDLAAGTGSNLRYVASGWDRSQAWLLVDQDPDLLSRARPVGSATVTTRVADLIDGGQMPAILERRDLITASALLDLVSRAWLEQMIAACQRSRATVLFALTYDGRMECSPEDPEDAAVRALVNQHQRTDKGFGAALGPDAAGCAAELLEAAGYRVLRESSDWQLQAGRGGTPASAHSGLGGSRRGTRHRRCAIHLRLARPAPGACHGKPITPRCRPPGRCWDSGLGNLRIRN